MNVTQQCLEVLAPSFETSIIACCILKNTAAANHIKQWTVPQLSMMIIYVHGQFYFCGDKISSLLSSVVTFHIHVFIIPTPQNVGGGAILDLLCRVRPSVRPSPIHVRSITHLLMEGFPSNLNDTFTSTRRCAEPMLQMCQLKVRSQLSVKY